MLLKQAQQTRLSLPLSDPPRGVALSRSVDLGNIPLEMLVSRARRLAMSNGRCILGIAGPPGAGKSTLAEAIADALGDLVRLVPMDGFHLAQAELARLGLTTSKGSPVTFDSLGYVNLLRRLRLRSEDVVYAPTFDRTIEEAVAGAIPVARDVPLIVTEGNYLLSAVPPWAEVRGLLDEAWYCSVADDVRRARLVDRHIRFGKSAEDARLWADGSDESNAETVAATRHRADLLFSLSEQTAHEIQRSESTG
jgi:pantothenate kinase